MSFISITRIVYLVPSLAVAVPLVATAAETLVVPTLSGPIVIDGKLDDVAWSQVTPLPPLVLLKSGESVAPELQATARVAMDAAGLVVSINLREPQPKTMLSAAPAVLDSALWLDDDVELFLDPVGDGIEYYQFAINPAGSRADLYYIERGYTNKPWNPQWESAAQRSADAWTVEMRVPWSSLHQRPVSTDRPWRFQIARQRSGGAIGGPGYQLQSLFTTDRFHDAAKWGLLKVNGVPNGLGLTSAAPRFQVGKSPSGYTLTAQAMITNPGANAFSGTARISLGTTVVELPATVAARSSALVSFPATAVKELGDQQPVLRLSDAKGIPLFAEITPVHLAYEPMRLALTAPAYRDTLYIGDFEQQLKATVQIDDPMFGRIRWRVEGPSGVLMPGGILPVTAGKAELSAPAGDLPIGEAALVVEALNAADAVVLTVKHRLIKAGPASAIDARIDSAGMLTVNGRKTMLRGFYANFVYTMGSVSNASWEMPRSVNFLMSPSERQAESGGYWYITQVQTLPTLEEDCRANRPLSAATKAGLLKEVERVRGETRCIGYYLSDEPSYRALSPKTLREAYEILSAADPHRVVVIVDTRGEQYIDAADVLAPHPYNNPRLSPEGKRVFDAAEPRIAMSISASRDATAGRYKALWAMPQTFSYYEGGIISSDNQSVAPNLREARWNMLTCIANGAQGMWPFILCGAWNDLPCRYGTLSTMDDLALIEEAWLDDSESVPVKVSGGTLDAVARWVAPAGQRPRLYLVVTNRTGAVVEARISSPKLKGLGRMQVLRELRSLTVLDDAITDRFEPLDARIYTSVDVLPLQPSLAELEADLAQRMAPHEPGSLLRDGLTDWTQEANGRNGRLWPSALVDGNLDAPGWIPWGLTPEQGSRELTLTFAKGVTFSRIVWWSNNIRGAVLESFAFGSWSPVATWTERSEFRSEWRGPAVSTVKLRLRITAVANNRSGQDVPTVSEIEMFP